LYLLSHITFIIIFFFFLMSLPPPRSTLFPYTTLFRSSIRKYNEDNLSPVTSDRLYLSISGEILKVEKFKDKPLNQKIAALIKPRSEEHTSELQSRENLVCRLLLEKKKKTTIIRYKKQS